MSFSSIILGLDEEGKFLVLQWVINLPSVLSRCIFCLSDNAVFVAANLGVTTQLETCGLSENHS